MWRLFERKKELGVESPAGRGSACERRCEADRLARQTLDQLLRQGWRLA